MGLPLPTKCNNWRSVSAGNYYESVVFGQYNDISCVRVLYSYYMVLFTLVDLQSRCMGQVSEPVDICLGKVLRKSLNWWMANERYPVILCIWVMCAMIVCLQPLPKTWTDCGVDINLENLSFSSKYQKSLLAPSVNSLQNQPCPLPSSAGQCFNTSVSEHLGPVFQSQVNGRLS